MTVEFITLEGVDVANPTNADDRETLVQQLQRQVR